MSIEMGKKNDVLRDELDKITCPADATELKAQIQNVANLGLKYPHSISLLQENVPGSPMFNCYQYCFNLEAIRFDIGIRRVFPGRDFVQFLLDHYLQEIETKDVENGDHVLYSSSQINHAGRANQGHVDSKWGTGHLWRHGVYELPARYGQNAQFFKHVERDVCIRAFLELNPQTRIGSHRTSKQN